MPKIPHCDRCIYCAHDYHLVCVPHPEGPDSDTCPDFSPDPTLTGKRFEDFLGLGDSDSNEELWEPEGASYCNGELILQPRPRLSKAEQMELLSTHPLFTDICPSCGYRFPSSAPPPVHWDCPSCDWVDDSV